MGRIGCPETSVINCDFTLPNIPKQRTPSSFVRRNNTLRRVRIMTAFSMQCPPPFLLILTASKNFCSALCPWTRSLCVIRLECETWFHTHVKHRLNYSVRHCHSLCCSEETSSPRKASTNAYVSCEMLSFVLYLTLKLPADCPVYSASSERATVRTLAPPCFLHCVKSCQILFR
jgi:hypothetical protein